LKLYIDRVNRSDLYILLIEAAKGIMKLIRVRDITYSLLN